MDGALIGSRDEQANNKLSLFYAGSSGRLAGLVLKTTLLTILTLGIYRFWMTTELRRHFWSAIRIGDEPLEYTGKGVELLLGFLIAALFLAIYFGVFYFVITFGVLNYGLPPEAITPLTIATIIPFLPYAKYRSERYLLSRTRWRGIRLGLDLAAWSYTWRALLWWAATALTLGLLWPVADFNLRRYITARTSYGDQRFELKGGSGGLYVWFLPVWLLAAASIALAYLAAEAGVMTTIPQTGQQVFQSDPGLSFSALFIGFLSLLLYLCYTAYRIRYNLNRIEFGDRIYLSSSLNPVLYLGVIVTGFFAIIGASIVATGFLFAASEGLIALMGDGPAAQQLGNAAIFNQRFQEGHVGYIAASILGYLALIVMFAIVAILALQKRLLRAIVNSVSIANIDRLDIARQRQHEEERSAEGFADALDVGAF